MSDKISTDEISTDKSTPVWKVCAKKINTSGMSDRDKEIRVWTNMNIHMDEKIDCDGSDGNYYYDQLITQLYDEGYRVFINEIGRGVDDEINNVPYYFSMDGSETPMKNIPICIIVFGSYTNETKEIYLSLKKKLPKLKIIEAGFYFDEEFATQFVEWYNSYENNNKILMEFLDLTDRNVDDEINILKNVTVKKLLFKLSKIVYSIGTDGKTKKSYNIYGNTYDNITTIVSSVIRNCVLPLYKGGYYNKYLKYKTKYLKLKNKVT